MKNIMNQFGKIHTAVIFMLVVLFTIPTLLYHQYQLHGALVPAGKVIEVSGKVAELKYKREEKTVVLKLNDPLFYEDWIMTGPNSTVRVLLDEGKKAKEKVGFFIYENSKFKIDKAIIDKAGNKKIVVQHTQGFLRTLTQGFKKGDEVQIITPTALVGVRGCDVGTQVSGGGGVSTSSSNISTLTFKMTGGSNNSVVVKTLTVNMAPSGSALVSKTFDLGSSLVVPKNGTTTLEVKVNTLTGQPISVMEKGGSSVTLTAVDPNENSLNLGEGDLKINVTSSSAGAPQAAAGASTATFGKFNFTAHGDAIRINTLKVTPTSSTTTSTSTFTSVSLYESGTKLGNDVIVTPGSFTNGTFNITGNGVMLMPGQSYTFDVKGNVITGTATFPVAGNATTVGSALNPAGKPDTTFAITHSTNSPSTNSTGKAGDNVEIAKYNFKAGSEDAAVKQVMVTVPATNTSEQTGGGVPTTW